MTDGLLITLFIIGGALALAGVIGGWELLCWLYAHIHCMVWWA